MRRIIFLALLSLGQPVYAGSEIDGHGIDIGLIKDAIFVYKACVLGTATNLSSSSSTAYEIADAAISSCRSDEALLQKAVEAAHQNSRLVVDPREMGSKVAGHAKDHMRQEAIRVVVEDRAKRPSASSSAR